MRDGDSLASRALWVGRHLIYGSFVGAYRARRGLGQPKDPAALDAEYRSGTWDYLDGLTERARHLVALGYIIDIEGPPRVLDIGCGTGAFLEFAKGFPLGEYHGIDLSEAAILRARRRFRGKDIAFPVSFEVGDFETFTSETPYDVILLGESIPYARDPLALLKRYEDLLSPRGVFLISLCYNWWQHPLLERIGAVYSTMHSAEVINEQGLAWEVRLLAGQRSREPLQLRTRRGIWLSSERASELAEQWVMIRENLRAILRGVPGFIWLRRGRPRYKR